MVSPGAKTDGQFGGSDWATPPSVAGIIVSYHPSLKLRHNVAALRPQVNELLIVDNGSGDASRALLEEIASTFHCEVIFNETNCGIAEALNQGVTRAEEKGCTFVALFDQDSCVTDSFIQTMLATYTSYKGLAAPAMVAPTYVDERSGLRISLPKDKDGTVPITMTSGTVIPLSTFRQYGHFETSLFIDLVDTEYCLRLRTSGRVIVQSNSAILLHSLGDLRRFGIGRIRFSATNHSAVRRYYMSRNRIILYRRYLSKCPQWVMRDLWKMIKETIKIILVEDHRLDKLHSSLQGIRDGLVGTTGEKL